MRRKTNRYAEKFAELKEKSEAAFIPFVVLGDPDAGASKKILSVLASHADCLELGFPFSDPIADGKRIQSAGERALACGTSVKKCFELVKLVRDKNPGLPIGLLVYYNLVFSNNARDFLERAGKCGVDSVLIADLPVEEAGEISGQCKKIGLKQIFTAAPTTNNERLKMIFKKAGGFIYIVSVLGVTGERKKIGESTLKLVRRVKKVSKLPVCVGFGVSKPEQVRKIVRAGADGTIVGSAIEAIIENNIGNEGRMLSELQKFCTKMKGATRIGS